MRNDREWLKGGRGRSCMGCRRIVVSLLRVLIWRHSARQYHLVLRGFSSPLVSSRPRQSPGFNIKPPWSTSLSLSLSLSRLLVPSARPFSRPRLCLCLRLRASTTTVGFSTSARGCCLRVPSAKPDMHNRTIEREKPGLWKPDRRGFISHRSFSQCDACCVLSERTIRLFSTNVYWDKRAVEWLSG